MRALVPLFCVLPLLGCGSAPPAPVAPVAASSPPRDAPPQIETCARVEVDTVLVAGVFVPDATPEEQQAFAAAHVDLLDAEIARRDPELFAHLPEQRRFSHVMIALANDAPTSAVRAAQRRAATILRRARAGEDFATLARAESADTQSAAAGGDLGWFHRGMVFSEIDDAVFAATEVGVLPSVVRTQIGLHVLAVTGIRAARDHASIEEARETVTEAAELRSRRLPIVEAMFARARARMEAEGSTLGDALGAEDADPISEEHGPFRADEPPTILGIYPIELHDFSLASLTALAPGEVLGPVIGMDHAWSFQRLPDVPCVPRFVVRAPPDADPTSSPADMLRAIAHGLAWAYGDCYRAHALESERHYGTIGMMALVGETGSAFAVVSDELENHALSHCVLGAFDHSLGVTSDGAPEETISFEVGFDPPPEP